MQLPRRADGQGVEIGISDILAWRECAARAKFGRRRLTGNEAPESRSPANAYGSAIHDCLQALDDGATPDEAAGAAMAKFRQWLEPSDLSLLHEDMGKYLERQRVGVRTLLNEGEISFKLFVHPTAGQVWFRARIDRLYQALNDPGQLIMMDFKSSRWAKSHEEVSADLQLWSYNLAIDEWFTDLYPEVEDVRILQVYDQLRYGEILTQKSAAQRAEMKRWLIAAVTAMIADEKEEPTFNEWCPWCPLKMDCPVVQYQLTDWATTRIAALMPREEKLNKDGSVSKRPGPVKLDRDRLGEYVEMLHDVRRAEATLKAFNEQVTKTLKEMPDSELHLLGKKKSERSSRVFDTAAKRKIVEEIGLPEFLMLADLSLSAVDRFYGDNKEQAEAVKQHADKRPGYVIVEDL